MTSGDAKTQVSRQGKQQPSNAIALCVQHRRPASIPYPAFDIIRAALNGVQDCA